MPSLRAIAKMPLTVNQEASESDFGKVSMTSTDELVTMLPCDTGCRGVQYGAKQGGGYYAYVASKFSNRLLVVDPDPNGDGDPSDAKIVGTVGLFSASTTQKDSKVKDNPSLGGRYPANPAGL